MIRLTAMAAEMILAECWRLGEDFSDIHFFEDFPGLFEAGELHAWEFGGGSACRYTPAQGFGEVVLLFIRPEESCGQGITGTDGRDGVDAGWDGFPNSVG